MANGEPYEWLYTGKVEYNTDVDYIIGVDAAHGSDTTYTTIDGLAVLGHDPETCEHEWWEDTMMTYTSDPPQKRQMCRLCGKTRFVPVRPVVQSFRWKRVF